jgi:pimeloyl-ACP methyl ester carboxylesterase
MILHSKIEGAGAKTLVVLHGLMGSLENWRTIQRALVSFCRVICIDFANHGQSPSAPLFTLDTLVADVFETMDSLGVKSFSLLGHSLGGKVAMLMASERPERVKALIVVDVTLDAISPAHLFILRACRGLALETATTRAELDAELSRSVVQPETRAFLLKNIARDDAGRFSWRVPLDHLIANYAAVSAALELKQPYKGPLLMMAGGKSPFRVMQREASLRQLFPQITFEVFPEAGHLLHSEEPQRFVEVVRKFLAE